MNLASQQHASPPAVESFHPSPWLHADPFDTRRSHSSMPMVKKTESRGIGEWSPQAHHRLSAGGMGHRSNASRPPLVRVSVLAIFARQVGRVADMRRMCLAQATRVSQKEKSSSRSQNEL